MTPFLPWPRVTKIMIINYRYTWYVTLAWAFLFVSPVTVVWSEANERARRLTCMLPCPWGRGVAMAQLHTQISCGRAQYNSRPSDQSYC